MTAQLKSFSIDTRRAIFIAMISICLASAGLYIYAVLATVNHTVARKNLMALSNTLETSVSELEFKDISLKNKINLELATVKGLSEVRSPLYISRESSALTYNTLSR